MIQRLAVACFSILIATTVQAAPVVWQGEAVIDAATGQCAAIPSAGVRPNSVLKTVIQPKNISGNTSNTIISFVSNDILMFDMVIDKGAMPRGSARAFGNNSSGIIEAQVVIPYSAFVQTPATIVASTPDVKLRGAIENFLFTPGCDVTFRAVYTKRTK